MKQSLLTDIELDVQELRYLIDALDKEHNQALCEIAKRNVLQMRSRLDTLYEELLISPETAPFIEPQEQKEEEIISRSESEVKLPEKNVTPLFVSNILKKDLRHSISLNDSFRFTRELFGGDGERMNRIVEKVDAMTSYDEAVSFIESEITLDEANDAVADFMELLKIRFM